MRAYACAGNVRNRLEPVDGTGQIVDKKEDLQKAGIRWTALPKLTEALWAERFQLCLKDLCALNFPFLWRSQYLLIEHQQRLAAKMV